jgi:hypothetical protein
MLITTFFASAVQVFSRQAVQMDALISAFVEDIKQRAALYNEDSEGNLFTDGAVNEADGETTLLTHLSVCFHLRRAGVLVKKLSQLTPPSLG